MGTNTFTYVGAARARSGGDTDLLTGLSIHHLDLDLSLPTYSYVSIAQPQSSQLVTALSSHTTTYYNTIIVLIRAYQQYLFSRTNVNNGRQLLLFHQKHKLHPKKKIAPLQQTTKLLRPALVRHRLVHDKGRNLRMA